MLSFAVTSNMWQERNDDIDVKAYVDMINDDYANERSDDVTYKHK